MLDFAIRAGSTANAGVINSGSPNCSLRAKILYLNCVRLMGQKRYDLMRKRLELYFISYLRSPSNHESCSIEIDGGNRREY